MNDMVTISRKEYDLLREAADDLAGLRAYDRAKAELDAGEEELIPAEFADRIIDGENPIRVYREMRGLTQQELSERTGLARAYIAQLETAKRDGSVGSLQAIAIALRLTVDDLL